MTVDLAALAKLAAEATPGPWFVTDSKVDGDPEIGSADDEHGVLCRGHEYDDYGWIEDRNVAYIAAASPDVVAKLVRVALAAKDALPAAEYGGPVVAQAGYRDAVAELRAALSDLDA